jgi:hypothetical protein
VLAHLVFGATDDKARRAVGTRKQEMPFLPASLSVTAKTMAMWAYLPVVMNCLTPLSTKSSPSRTARVVMADASEPVCGSVRQKQPSLSPRASGFSHFPSAHRCRTSS